MKFHIDSKFNKGDVVYSGRLAGCVGEVKDIDFKYFRSVVTINYLVEGSNGTRVWLDEGVLSEKGW